MNFITWLMIVGGIAGSMPGRRLLSPLFGISAMDQSGYLSPGLLVPLSGAIAPLAIVNLVRRGAARRGSRQ